MNTPETLGSAGSVAIYAVRTDILVPLLPHQGRQSGRICVVLDEVRGKHDAAVMQLRLGVPGGEEPANVGSIGPYGLARASVEGAATFSLEVTAVYERLVEADPPALLLSVRLRRELPQAEATVIGRVLLVRDD